MLDARTAPDAAEVYRASVAKLFDITILGDTGTFHNRLEGYELPGAAFGRCVGVAQRFVRSRAHCRGDPQDSIQLIVAHRAGRWSGDYDGTAAAGDEGGLRLRDMGRPFTSITEDFETLNLVLPRRALPEDLDFHGLATAGDAGLARILRLQLVGLWKAAEQLTYAEAQAAVLAVSALVQGVFAPLAPPLGDHLQAAVRGPIAEARAFVDARLDDPALTPVALAAHLRLSRGALYRLFRPMGGVASFIQARRLDRAFGALMKPSRQSVAEVAYAHGFRSDSHFSRVFAARFGRPPSTLRTVHDVQERKDSDGIAAVMAWLDALG